MELIIGLALILFTSWMTISYDKKVNEEIKWQERNKSWNKWKPRYPWVSKKELEQMEREERQRKEANKTTLNFSVLNNTNTNSKREKGE